MPRILVVDDQKIPRLAVTAVLEDAGHEVRAASDGQQGLHVAREWAPDVIILDVYMPEMDGFAVVEQLKEDPRTAPAPVIFLTAEPPTDDLVVRGLDLGAYDFLSKGCSRAELLARVSVMTRIKRGNDELTAIARISDTLIQSLDPAELSRRFVEQVREVFRADAVIFSFSQPDEPRLHAASGMDPDDPLAEPLAAALLRQLEHSQGEVDAVAPAQLRGPAGVPVRRAGIRSIVAVRVDHDHEGRESTLLAIFSRRLEAFVRDSDAPLLHLLARQATIALDNAALHARTRAQARKMEEQADKLEHAMSERSRFFASMSHELRTPINAVIGYNQLLETGAYGDVNDGQREALERVSRSAQHLLELINDVLDISKIEAGKLEINVEETDLAALLRDTITSVQLQAQDKGLMLEVEAPEQVEAVTDPARVRQILLNLLSNAVKFTAEGEVRVQMTQRSDANGARWIDVRVRDTGPGIAPEDQDRIFEEFEQTRGTRGREGTGLGLAISRRLAHLLGGELSLQSRPGEGSTFTLRLPA